ncbi:MAG: hypothetical protein HY260_11230 [Chloroflexi bacterium]|nr:hypothetical protein [Chloroflexota bacterium]
MDIQPGRAEDVAILRTLLYADVFDYPLTADEVHHFLIGLPLSRERVKQVLQSSPWLAERTVRVNGYFTAQGRAEVAAKREERERASRALWHDARRYGRWIGHLPFVRMVAVTGALAMNNSAPGDDIDFLIVTAPGRVWLARALCIAIVRLVGLWGVKVCPNYILAESALAQGQQDLFIAHEVAQMTPLVGHSLYAEMRRANAWSLAYLPNANVPLRAEPDAAPRGAGRRLQRMLEWLWRGELGERLESWERKRKIAKFRRQAQLPSANAVLDESHVKGHFADYRRPALTAYEERLERYGVAGDGVRQ